jgi:uncharacterized membrane protein YfcA
MIASDTFLQTIGNPAIHGIDTHLYWFMFPVAITVATCAISAGIGGAAIFAPIFLIVFPLLGEQYIISTPQEAVATAILTESFGFASGLVGYFRRGLVDVKLAIPFAALSVPASAFSALYLVDLCSPAVLKCIYTALMLTVGFSLLSAKKEKEEEKEEEGKDVGVGKENGTTNGTTALLAVGGGLLTGTLGVGIGEIVLPSLLRRGVSVGTAAASSTLVVALTAWTAAIFQLTDLAQDAGGSLASVIPWELVIYLIPGVTIGGQIASRLQGRIKQDVLERAIGSLFVVIGAAFGTVVAKEGTAFLHLF